MMLMENTWSTLSSKERVDKTIKALKNNGIDAIFVNTAQEAKEKVLSLIPQGAEVMNMSSETLQAIGVANEIQESGKYNSVRKTLMGMDRVTQSREMQKLGSAPEYSIGSVHAVTEEGQVVIASMSGSQLPGYVYGSVHVVWVVGTQKIVKNLDDAMKRIYEYVLPLESKRINKAYGIPGSSVDKVLTFFKENPGRITLIFVNEALGF